MLPYISTEDNLPPMARKVYINPNFPSQVVRAVTQQQQQASLQGHFAQQHRPLLSVAQPAIHINPKFLQRQQCELVFKNLALQQQQQLRLLQQQQQQVNCHNSVAAKIKIAATPQQPIAKIINKARTCIVRRPREIVAAKNVVALVQPPLLSKTKRKIVRQCARVVSSPKTATTPTIMASPAKRSRYKLVRAISLTSSSTPLIKKRRKLDFVGRYALRRTNDSCAAKKLSLKPHVPKPSVNKCLHMVSIHGVMYKKTAKNKLTKFNAEKPTNQTPAPFSPHKTLSAGRTLFVRGTKFVLDPSGRRLTRILVNSIQAQEISTAAPQNDPSTTRRRIDIGGLTYVASSKVQNVYIRTANHVSRAHLMTAKQRSLQLLNRSLAKTNVPCAIFQRLGKCAAHARGKCRNLHDKRQVAICPSFLRGECTKAHCLLSHNVTLEKMPVCRYYLRGVCVREDCPYLHKKLSRTAEICVEFLRGYCSRAAECNKRHEFVCPEFARKGKCELTNCAFCKQMLKSHAMISKKFAKKKTKTKPKIARVQAATEHVEATIAPRYFKCNDKVELSMPLAEHQEALCSSAEEESDDDVSPATLLPKRPKLGELPAFIPLDEK